MCLPPTLLYWIGMQISATLLGGDFLIISSLMRGAARRSRVPFQLWNHAGFAMGGDEMQLIIDGAMMDYTGALRAASLKSIRQAALARAGRGSTARMWSDGARWRLAPEAFRYDPAWSTIKVKNAANWSSVANRHSLAAAYNLTGIN